MWSYRVVEYEYEYGLYYQVHTVFLDGGIIKAISQDPVTPFGETEHELMEDIRRITEAKKHPTLKRKYLDSLFDQS